MNKKKLNEKISHEVTWQYDENSLTPLCENSLKDYNPVECESHSYTNMYQLTLKRFIKGRLQTDK